MRLSEACLWDFVLALYRSEGVGPACLQLQESIGLDVNILLTGAWLGCRGVHLAASDIGSLNADVASWQGEVVRPLRALRERMKQASYPAPEVLARNLRETIKGAELEAERVELLILERRAAMFHETQRRGRELALRNCETVIDHFSRGEEVAAARDALLALDRALEPAAIPPRR